jgi:hypothetical protein
MTLLAGRLILIHWRTHDNEHTRLPKNHDAFIDGSTADNLPSPR